VVNVAFVTLDFETYYAKDFSLTKLTTEEYIRSPYFEVIGVGIKIDDDKPEWFSGTHKEIKARLDQIDWSESALLCHNTMFDGAILSFIFNIVPAYYFDTLCMARAKHGVDVSGSLANLVKMYGLGQKGTEVVEALGKRRKDFTPADLHRYGEYCVNDVVLTFALFNTFISDYFPQSELDLIDMTLRMYTQPVLEVNDAMLVERLEEVKNEKSELLAGLQGRLGCTTEEEVRQKLASNPQFAAVLKDLDIPVPMKISPTTGKETFALAKNDEGFIELLEHDDPFIQQLCSVRLGTKSTIEESRIERFIGIGSRNRGRLPIPLKYYGAHTGRWAGSDSVNFQNLPSRDKKKKTLKNSIMAPEGHVVINCDSSQIEARVLAWLAGQDDVTQQFANGEDVYSIFASKVYKKPISKANPVERFVGKTCILGLGYGTGAKKLQHTLKTQPPGADLPEEECKRIVDLYRESNHMITDLWRECDSALQHLSSWPLGLRSYAIGKHGVVRATASGIRLPNELFIRYPDLRLSDKKYIYKSRRGVTSIWGGAMVENIVQALARIIVGEQMLKIREQYRPVLTVHDAAVIVAPKAELDKAVAFITQVMSTPPSWATGLPVACEAKYGESYGEC
jgi:DNA polymerase I-like protein with 3'-5' exonuclease and polymerase domains